MEDFSFSLIRPETNISIQVSTEIAEPDRVYISMAGGHDCFTAQLAIEEANELIHALQFAVENSQALADNHMEDLEEIEAMLAETKDDD